MKQNKEKIVDNIALILTIFVISAIIGFIYETVFYRIDLGYFIKRGTSFGPWVPIYGFGGVLIYILCEKYKDSPLKIFVLSLVVSTMIEFITGYILYHVFNTRLWDYNTEIWNFGNIGGYVCLRSVLLFAIAGIFLIKLVLPTIINIKTILGKNIFNRFACFLGIICIIDILINIFSKIVL